MHNNYGANVGILQANKQGFSSRYQEITQTKSDEKQKRL